MDRAIILCFRARELSVARVSPSVDDNQGRF
jgi:hypothetical protein